MKRVLKRQVEILNCPGATSAGRKGKGNFQGIFKSFKFLDVETVSKLNSNNHTLPFSFLK